MSDFEERILKAIDGKRGKEREKIIHSELKLLVKAGLDDLKKRIKNRAKTDFLVNLLRKNK
jgi:hypothetical protein